MNRSESISEKLKLVREKMATACASANRDLSSVKLVAISKTKPLELIREAAAAGQTVFGENYVQEAVDKVATAPEFEWHFVGHVQTNKAKMVAGSFSLIHSVDRLKLAIALNEAAAARGVVQKILLQIQIGDEESKHGFSFIDAPDVALAISEMKNLELRGLMSLPPLEESETKARKNFSLLRESLQSIGAVLPKETRALFRELSIGTSSDFEWAILEGATLVRVGSDIFGARGS